MGGPPRIVGGPVAGIPPKKGPPPLALVGVCSSLRLKEAVPEGGNTEAIEGARRGDDVVIVVMETLDQVMPPVEK